jgi:outer membrane protein OmpA-like peptidoglycan-associated protein
MMRRCLFLIGLLITGLALPAQARFGADPSASEWTSVPGTGACHLVHPVPRFGTLIVTQYRTLGFDGVLVTRRPPLAARRGELLAVSPAWKVSLERRSLPPVEASPGLNTVRFDERSVRLLLGGLEQGDLIVMRFPDWAGRPIEAALSPVGFRPALRQHLDCLAGTGADPLAPTTAAAAKRPASASGVAPQGAVIAAVRETSVSPAASVSAGNVSASAGVATGTEPVMIHFAHDNARLDRVDLDAIAAIAERLRTGAVWNRVVVTGHTDATGRRAYNEALGLARALEVRNRLVALGIASDRIEVRTWAASRPLAGNDTVYGRAVNRRVEVRGEL